MSYIVYDQDSKIIRSVVFNDLVRPVVRSRFEVAKVPTLQHAEGKAMLGKVFNPETGKVVDDNSTANEIPDYDDGVLDPVPEESTPSEPQGDAKQPRVEEEPKEEEQSAESVSPSSISIEFENLPEKLVVNEPVEFQVVLKDGGDGSNIKGKFVATINTKGPIKVSRKRKFEKGALKVTVTLTEDKAASIKVSVEGAEPIAYKFNA